MSLYVSGTHAPNTRKINDIEQLENERKKQAEIEQQQEQLRLAEIERSNRQAQEIELNRTAFERSIMPHVQQHFKNVRHAGIEFDYDFSNYSLYRAVKATTALQNHAEQGDTASFKQSFVDYKNAMLGEKLEREHSKLNKLAQTGDIGIIEKFEQRDLGVGIHYEWNKPNHLELKYQTINLAKAINNRVTQIVDFAKKNKVISENDGLQIDLLDYLNKKPRPYQEINQKIESHLNDNEKRTNKYVSELTKRCSNSYKNT